MTKKDYIKIANMLQKSYIGTRQETEERQMGADSQFDDIVAGMTYIFKEDNSLFDEYRFNKAVYEGTRNESK